MKNGWHRGLPARVWKATLADIVGNIHACQEAAKVKVVRAIFKRTESIKDKENRDAENYRLCYALKAHTWRNDKYLRRKMRQHYRRGHTDVDNQIVLDCQSYTWTLIKGQGWLAVQSREKGNRIMVPLNNNYPITGNIRLIIKDKVYVHYIAECKKAKPCGTKTMGVDKGYTEAFVDNEGQHHGEGLGKVLSKFSDKRKVVYQHRNKLLAVANKCKEHNPAKHDRIIKHNLGRQKLDKAKKKETAIVKDIVYKAAHSVFDKAGRLGAEDLTEPIKNTRPMTKDLTRQLSGWVKGILALALLMVSQRRGALLQLVNAAYSSQECSLCHGLGQRKGDTFKCMHCMVELDADQNAAGVMKHRLDCVEITRYMPYREVKKVLQEISQRLSLSRQGSSASESVG